MKLNWGTSIVLAFVAFISFILFFVVQMSTVSRAEHDLVTEDYYRDELGYQEDIDAQQNANDLTSNLNVKIVEKGLYINFPTTQKAENISGRLYFYRPSNKKFDFNLPLELANSQLFIPEDKLLEGRWNIKVMWNYNGKSYLHKENISY